MEKENTFWSLMHLHLVSNLKQEVELEGLNDISVLPNLFVNRISLKQTPTRILRIIRHFISKHLRLNFLNHK